MENDNINKYLKYKKQVENEYIESYYEIRLKQRRMIMEKNMYQKRIERQEKI